MQHYTLFEKGTRVKREIYFLGGSAWQHGVIQRARTDMQDSLLVKWEDGELKEMLSSQISFA